ncbi:hypothetical protein LVJ94_18345 [Pendulispora rubella]|uniref:Uncharacterized protein n=1 Tax=Pendulispora rubella TaxID=2741070 RepID=A0ABZ2LE13_9BACT
MNADRASGAHSPSASGPLARRATTLVSRPPPPPAAGVAGATSATPTPPPAGSAPPPDVTTAANKANLAVTGVISRGVTPTPDDTVPQRNATAPSAPSAPTAPLAPQVGMAAQAATSSPSNPDDTGRGRIIATPAPSSTPLDRYSQTHIPIEVRERIRVIVREVVEESMAPLVRWQKDVETRLSRAPAPGTPPSSGNAPYNGGSSSAAAPIVVDRESFHDPFLPVSAPASRAPNVDFVPSPGGPVDVPLELDGGRRKRSVIWIIATVVLLLLVGFLSAMATSQLR